MKQFILGFIVCACLSFQAFDAGLVTMKPARPKSTVVFGEQPQAGKYMSLQAKAFIEKYVALGYQVQLSIGDHPLVVMVKY